MRGSSARLVAVASKSDRSGLRLSEENFGSVISDIAIMLWPPPNSAAKIAAEIGCSVRSAELYLDGTQKWSGDGIAIIVAEILKRHAMRNVRVTKRE